MTKSKSKTARPVVEIETPLETKIDPVALVDVEVPRTSGSAVRSAASDASELLDFAAPRVPSTVRRLAPTHAVAPSAGGKQAHVIGLLGRQGGASIDELMGATGWLAHTTRAAMTGLPQAGACGRTGCRRGWSLGVSDCAAGAEA